MAGGRIPLMAVEGLRMLDGSPVLKLEGGAMAG